MVACWRETCITNGADLPGFDSVWSRFTKKRKIQIKIREGELLEQVEAKIPCVAVADDIRDMRYAPVMRVMIALSEVHAAHGRNVFHAGYRLIAKLAGMKESDAKKVQRWLGDLSRMGYVSLMQAGTIGTRRDGDASDWMVHLPPCPGRTVWRSNACVAKERQTSNRSPESDSDFAW